MNQARSLKDLFWRRVLKTEGCWTWTRHTNPKGYGVVAVGGGRNKSAHRFAWQLTHGPIPAGMHVCHRCDNPPCVRPDHLFLGTNADNMADMRAKGRHARGERMGAAKLTDSRVAALLRDYVERHMSMPTLAAKYGVDSSNVARILTGKAWTHVPRPLGYETAQARVSYGNRNKLSDREIAVIKGLVSAGRTRTEVAEMFGVHNSHVSRLVRGLRRPALAKR